MNIYYAFYCRAYNWYNTTGKKSKETLRLSAIALLSVMPNINLISIVILISILNQHTFINRWGGVTLMLTTIIFNWVLINPQKSDLLTEEYFLLGEQKKRKINIYFFLYLSLSALLLFASLAYITYFKRKFGNFEIR
jgi:hypothetical protein